MGRTYFEELFSIVGLVSFKYVKVVQFLSNWNKRFIVELRKKLRSYLLWPTVGTTVWTQSNGKNLGILFNIVVLHL